MRKSNKLLTLAVAAAMMSPLAAQAADVEIYGKARMSLNITNNGANAPDESSATGISSNASRIGFKGSEALGNGMTAMFQAESEYNFDDGGWVGGGRDAYVGLMGGFGTVKAGRLSTPYKQATAKIDPFSDTPGDYNAIIRHDTRADNMLQYSSKNMDGLSFAAGYMTAHGNDGAGSSDDELAISAANTDYDGISASASYTQGSLMATLAIENLSMGPGAAKDKATKLGVMYSLDSSTKIGGVYEMIDDGGTDNSTLYVSATNKMDAKNTLKGAIGSRGSTSGASDGATFIAFGMSHQYTKNVEVYGLYVQVANDAGMGGQPAPLEPKYAFDDRGGINDETASSLSFGINMSFSSM